MKTYIDTHCHLTFPSYDNDRNMVIGNAKKAGVVQMISPGVDFLSSQLSISLARQKPGCVFAGVGFHPYEAQQQVSVHELTHLLSEHVVAIGECGLDYRAYKNEKALGKKSNQKRLFEEHIELSVQERLPLIIHCRDAFDDLFDSLEKFRSHIKGVLHCFSGGLQDIRRARQYNLFVGLDGNITYSKNLKRIIPDIPLSMILLETDSPYLTPVPHRGKRNEPKYLPIVAQMLASLHKTGVDEIARITTENARRLFNV